MRKYRIDYGNNRAVMWADVPEEEAIECFRGHAHRCFGIRKSITKEPEVLESAEEPLPAWARLDGAAVALEHNFPISDKIVWNADGVKVLNEWGESDLDEQEPA